MRVVKLFSPLVVLVGLLLLRGDDKSPSPTEVDPSPVMIGNQSLHLIGPTAIVQEDETDLTFTARVDTGARRCSLHVAEWIVEGGSSRMIENLGKTIRFRLENRRGDSSWLERKIAEVALIRTSEKDELRYLVPLSLAHRGVERKVLVSLNDRSRMDYAMLLGRNYLAGEFVVDVTTGPKKDQLAVTNPPAPIGR